MLTLTNKKHGRKRRIHKQKTKGKLKSSQGTFWFNCLSSQMKLLISGYWDEKSLFPSCEGLEIALVQL